MISDLISQRACRTMSSVETEATSSGMGYNEHPASPAAHKQLSHLTLRIVPPLHPLTLVVALTFAEPVAPRTFERQIASALPLRPIEIIVAAAGLDARQVREPVDLKAAAPHPPPDPGSAQGHL